MHNYQKMNYVILSLMMSVSATVAAKSFPQDYLNTNQSLETAHAVVAESNKFMNSAFSASPKLQPSPQHIHELQHYGKKSETVEIKGKMIKMTDAKSTSTFHLFEQYL